MKCLSVRQPWANLFFEKSNPKTIETRTRRTNYRGELLIISSAKWSNEAMVLDVKKELAGGFKKSFSFGFWYKEISEMNMFKNDCGFAIGVVDLVDCRPMVESDEMAARCELYPGAWSWITENPRAIERFPMVGQLGIFERAVPELVYIENFYPWQ